MWSPVTPTIQNRVPQVKHEYGLNPDFGFDPSLPEQNIFDHVPANANEVANWSGFGSYDFSPQIPQDVLARNHNSAHRHSLSHPHFPQHNRATPQSLARSGINSLPTVGPLSINTKHHANVASTPSAYGQVTPPRSDSAASEPLKHGQDPTSATSGPSTTTTKRRRGKAQGKNPLTHLVDNPGPTSRKTSGRERTTSVAQLSSGNPEDDKRKMSLEKNRVAAAKCRINKKEKTEQLQRDSHTKAQENVQLRGLVETMEAERNTLAAYLSAYASCVDCRNPRQLKEALQIFQEDAMKKRFPELVGDRVLDATSPVLSVSGLSMDSGLYDDAAMTPTDDAMHPPLPEFNLDDDYDVNSPLPS